MRPLGLADAFVLLFAASFIVGLLGGGPVNVVALSQATRLGLSFGTPFHWSRLSEGVGILLIHPVTVSAILRAP